MVPCWQAVWRVIFTILVLFGVLFERQKVDKKSKPTRKLKHTNPISGYFEYFCQMSSKSIFIILSYTVSKLVRFFLRHSVVCLLFSHKYFKAPSVSLLKGCYSLFFVIFIIKCLYSIMAAWQPLAKPAILFCSWWLDLLLFSLSINLGGRLADCHHTLPHVWGWPWYI